MSTELDPLLLSYYQYHIRMLQCMCNGSKEGVPGGVFVLAYWKVRVFWSSGIVDRRSERLYIRTISLHGCMYRISRYTPFSSQAGLYCHRKTCALSAFNEKLSHNGIPLRGPLGFWTFSDEWAAWWVPQNKKISSKNWEVYNIGVCSTLVTRFHHTKQLQKTCRSGLSNSTSDFCWLDLPWWDTAVLQG